jgi:EmrB/QacA subfamily drug resistance transporter
VTKPESARSDQPDAAVSNLRIAWVIFVACAAVSLVVAAVAALNTALPDIAPDIGATNNQLTWIVDGYTLALAALLFPAGAIGDKYGRRGILMAGLVMFAAGSAMPIWIDEPTWFVVSRVITGVGAAFVMPATLSLITSQVPESKRALGVSVWAAVAGVGAIAGFFVTGLLLEFFSWRSIFVTFVISTVLVLVLVTTIGSTKDSTSPKFDIPGSVVSVVAIAIFVFALVEAPHSGWTDAVVLLCLIGGLLLMALFVWLQLRTDHPLLDVRVFRSRALSAGTLAILLQNTAVFGMFFLILQQFQLIYGYSPLGAAVGLVPMVIVVMVFSLLGNWLAVKFNLKAILTAGMLIMGVGMVLLGVYSDAEYWTYTAVLAVMALGFGVAQSPSTSSIMVNTPLDNQGIGSALNDTARELGASIGIAVAGSLLAAGYSHKINATAEATRAQLNHQADQLATAGQPEQAAQMHAAADQAADHLSRSLAEALQVAKQLPAQDQSLAQQITQQAHHAFTAPAGQSSIVLGVLVLIGGAIMAWLAPIRMQDDATHPVTTPE